MIEKSLEIREKTMKIFGEDGEWEERGGGGGKKNVMSAGWLAKCVSL